MEQGDACGARRADRPRHAEWRQHARGRPAGRGPDSSPRAASRSSGGPRGARPARRGRRAVAPSPGSPQPGERRREQPARRGARLNVEADSLNAAVLGPDAQPGSATWDVFVQDVVRDMTQKAGQKCTAVRRIFVAGDQLSAVREALVEKLAQVRVGDPARSEVTMGPLSTADQLRDVRAGIAKLASEADPIFGGDGTVKALAPEGKGYFVSPVLLLARDPTAAKIMHRDEVFGPVATLAPARSPADLVRRG